MINWALYRREMKGSVKLLLILAGVMTLYISVIIRMYDPEMMAMLDGFVEAMPEIMAAVGMSAGATSLLGFMVSYLYGFILLVFPMIYCIFRGNALIARHVDRGGMAVLMAAPVKRLTIVFTQMMVLLSGIVLLTGYVTILELCVGQSQFPGELAVSDLLRLNLGLFCLQFCIGGICFLASCLFSDTKYSIGFGAGIPGVMYVLQMLANTGEKAEAAKYFSVFTLFDPNGLAAGDANALVGTAVLFVGGLMLFSGGIFAFTQKDLAI